VAKTPAPTHHRYTARHSHLRELPQIVGLKDATGDVKLPAARSAALIGAAAGVENRIFPRRGREPTRASSPPGAPVMSIAETPVEQIGGRGFSKLVSRIALS
jgi:hypothetical protein